MKKGFPMKGSLFSSVSEVEEAGEGELPLAALLLHLGLVIR